MKCDGQFCLHTHQNSNSSKELLSKKISKKIKNLLDKI